MMMPNQRCVSVCAARIIRWRDADVYARDSIAAQEDDPLICDGLTCRATRALMSRAMFDTRETTMIR